LGIEEVEVKLYTFFALNEDQLSVSHYHCISFLRKGTWYTFYRLFEELHSYYR
jgi:hypothetical protein